MRLKIVSVLAMCGLAIAIGGCAGPPVATEFEVAGEKVTAPKSGQYSAEFEKLDFKNQTKTTLKLDNVKIDASGNLQAWTDSQKNLLDFIERQTNRVAIPGVVAPAAASPPATVTAGPAPPVVPK